VTDIFVRRWFFIPQKIGIATLSLLLTVGITIMPISEVEIYATNSTEIKEDEENRKTIIKELNKNQTPILAQGLLERCGDGIDNNGNGQIDENCP
jgi:hypothetical protein